MRIARRSAQSDRPPTFVCARGGPLPRWAVLDGRNGRRRRAMARSPIHVPPTGRGRLPGHRRSDQKAQRPGNGSRCRGNLSHHCQGRPGGQASPVRDGRNSALPSRGAGREIRRLGDPRVSPGRCGSGLPSACRTPLRLGAGTARPADPPDSRLGKRLTLFPQSASPGFL